MASRMKRSLSIGLTILAGSVVAPPGVQAAPIQFGNNYYELIIVADPFVGTNNSWDTANANAAASVFGGVNGHLATITSAAENAFLSGLSPGFTVFTGAWLGGTAATNPDSWLVGPETGQAFTYTNWGGIEPNNAGIAYMNIGALFANVATGQWADDSGVQGLPTSANDPVKGYFVEYESPTVVPEPATMSLIGLGLFGIAARRLRQRR